MPRKPVPIPALNRLLRLLAGVWLALAMGAGLWAGPGDLPPGRVSFRSYGSEQGLGNLAASSLLQDRVGFLWVGTEDGLYRYDGHRFQNFGMPEGLPSSFITALYEDPSGGLWVGTYQGLAKWEGMGFKAVDPASGLPASPIQGLGYGAKGALWVATPRGPYALQPGGQFAPVPGWPGGEASALFGRPDLGSVWVAAWQEWGPRKEARILEYRSGIWKAWEEPGGYGKERLDSLLADRNGRLWARGARHLWCLKSGGHGFEEEKAGIAPISARAFMSLDAAGNLYLPTDRGIYIREAAGWRVLGSREGLPTPWARWVLEDREGSLWVASLGVHRLVGRGLWRAYTQAEGLPNEVAWTIARDRNKDLLVGTDRGLYRATAQGWKLLEGSENNVVRTVQEAPDGTLFMSGVPVEVLRWNPRTQRVDGRFGAEAGLSGKRVFRLVLDREGTLWAATEGGGLQKAKAAGSGPMAFEPVILPGGSEGEYVSGLCLGASGRLWACGERGLALFEKGAWKRFTNQDGLLRTHVAYAIELRTGELLLAYFEAQGFSRVLIKEGRVQSVQHLEAGNPLAREKVYMMGEDSKGRAWIGTGQGVYVLDGDQRERFGLAEGLVGEDINNMAFLSDPGGDVWIGTSAGLARFDASAYRGQATPPPSVVLSYRLGDKLRVPGVGEDPVVPYRDNTFEVVFAGLSFLGEGYVQHQIRLRDLETDWHMTQTRESRYPALGAGAYVFEVRSRVGQGAWGPETTLRFRVLPAWWGTWWFRLLLALAGGGALFGVFRWRMRALKQQNRQLEDLVAARTRELEVANEALRNQSLTDPLTGLRNRRYLGVCMPEDVAQVNRSHRQVNLARQDRLALNIDLIFIMVDVDHFKSVNDAYGHHAGDIVLQQLAEILRAATRDTDTVVRWGGEEFLVVARNACRKEGAILVERIRAQVEAHPFDIGGGQTLRRTCSLGYSFFPFLPEHPGFLPWEGVVDLADHCLYAAKRSGRNAWVGLSAPLEAGPGDLGDNPGLRIPELLESGAMELRTSLPEGRTLEWDLKP